MDVHDFVSSCLRKTNHFSSRNLRWQFFNINLQIQISHRKLVIKKRFKNYKIAIKNTMKLEITFLASFGCYQPKNHENDQVKESTS